MGYRYLDSFGIEPEFCFGHGLSYTEFSYREARLEEKEGEQPGTVFVTCEIVNVGEQAGKETVQVYLRQRVRDKKSPYQTLAGFEKVELSPGEKKKVWIRLHGDRKDREIALGSSSRDIRKVIG